MNKQNLPAPPWPVMLRQFIIDQLASWKTKKEVYQLVTSKKFEDKYSIERLDPKVQNFKSFVVMCANIPKRELAKAHNQWLQRYDDIRWSGQKARVAGMSELVDKLMAKIKEDPLEYVDALAQLRMYMEQIRKEMTLDAELEAKASSGTRIFLQGSGSVNFTADLMKDVVLVIREEYGGLHNIDLTALTIDELKKLIDACTEVYEEKLSNEVPTNFEIIDEESDDDTM